MEVKVVPTAAMSLARRQVLIPLSFPPSSNRASRALLVTGDILSFVLALIIMAIPLSAAAYTVNMVNGADSVTAVRNQIIPSYHINP